MFDFCLDKQMFAQYNKNTEQKFGDMMSSNDCILKYNY